MRPLGELEAAVMDRIWTGDRPVLVREVVEALQPERPSAYTTVMTVMDNLHRKGWLTSRARRKSLAVRGFRLAQLLHRRADAGRAVDQ